MTPRFMMIEPCDFDSFPMGGQLEFSKALVNAFGSDVALVGFTCDSRQRVGEWTEIRVDDQAIHFFPFAYRRRSSDKPVVPARLTAYLAIRRYRRRILTLGEMPAFTQAPEALLALASGKRLFRSICYMFPGIENPLELSRYKWARGLARLYDQFLARSLRSVETVLACTDSAGVASVEGKLQRHGVTKPVKQFPTRFDETLFYPRPVLATRTALGLPDNVPIFVTVGRLNAVKGWDFLCQAFRRYSEQYGDARLVFVGDGEDRELLTAVCRRLGIEKHVILAGIQPPARVAEYLSAADVALVGSLREGWSIAMLEALGCGKPIVSTHVSGARDLIKDGVNGFVCLAREPNYFANLMRRSISFGPINQASLDVATCYQSADLRQAFENAWPAIAREAL